MADDYAARWTEPVGTDRRRLVGAIRRLSDALLRHEYGDAELDGAAAAVEDVLTRLQPLGGRTDRIDELQAAAQDLGTPADGERVFHNPDCIVCGAGNPAGPELEVRRIGDALVGEVRYGITGRGAPGRVHGGLLALAMDDLMGHAVLVLTGRPAYTVSLHVEYLGAAPVDAPVRIEARIASRDGRKITVLAEAVADEVPVVRAEALFIEARTLRPEAGG